MSSGLTVARWPLVTWLVSLIVVSAWLCWLVWIAAFPWQLISDDALNFARGMVRFSVLEFRPHFPGYPGFIAGAKGLAWLSGEADAERTIVAYSVLAVALIPMLIGMLSYRLANNVFLAASAVLAVLVSPLLAGLALSGLSDAPAIAFFLVALISAIERRAVATGLFLGLMLATRPSYLPLAVFFVVLPFIYQMRRRQLTVLLLPVFCVGSICLLFLLAKDGSAYFSEGLRFTQGHFGIWGNTHSNKMGQVSAWFTELGAIFTLPGLVIMTTSLMLTIKSKHHVLRSCGLIALGYFAFILLAQNPDNLRHFAPVYFLWTAVFSAQLGLMVKPVIVLSVMLVIFITALSLQWHQSSALAPSRQAIEYWQNKNKDSAFDGVIGSNYSVSLLREYLPDYAVFDMYYPSHDSMIIRRAADRQVWRLSGIEIDSAHYQLETTLQARFPTERDLYLYKLDSSVPDREANK